MFFTVHLLDPQWWTFPWSWGLFVLRVQVVGFWVAVTA